MSYEYIHSDLGSTSGTVSIGSKPRSSAPSTSGVSKVSVSRTPPKKKLDLSYFQPGGEGFKPPDQQSSEPSLPVTETKAQGFDLSKLVYETVEVDGESYIRAAENERSQFFSFMDLMPVQVEVLAEDHVLCANNYSLYGDTDFSIAKLKNVSDQIQVSSEKMSLWINDKVSKGYGIIIVEISERDIYLYATKNLKTATAYAPVPTDPSQVTGVVLQDPKDGWEKWGHFKKYALYAAGILALAGIGYYVWKSKKA